ncbi:MAG: hypothetical protein OQK76_06680 [Gammaproteobacteria bacterium]|nr:hypothetical protein [Gammaproteobacteria bacterium]MCW8910290.1 hypothetical protein [Gammaproteobacteria bacterium]MCW9005177.1 hypothetical protein [Gammaproteobacteria bacterium]MCW9057027.1 hypothetical protein [Gammaproteobacteria bacterium]
MNKIKLSVISLLLFGLTTSALLSADNRSEFEQWMKQETGSFQEYKDKRDREFAGFLKKQWQEMQTFQGLVRDKTPKPIKIPTAKPLPAKPPVTKAPAKSPIKKIPVVKAPVVKPALEKPVIIKPAPIIRLPAGKKIKLNFYGQSLMFSYDPKLKVKLLSVINADAMSRHWSALSLADYDSLIKQLQVMRKSLELNDWAYALLINDVAKGIYPRQQNERTLLIWFLLVKEGYSARIAYDANRVYLLLPTEQQLYASPYFTFDHVRYYALSFEGEKQSLGKVFTYEGHYPGANKHLDMRLNKTMKTLRKQRSRPLKFKFQGQNYIVNASYDEQTVYFLRTYPQMDIGMYFIASVNQATASPLLDQLRPLVEGKSEQDAINLLLRFVQTAFQYRTDEGQFGIENYLFPEETLHYPYSDCEDRSVFFAWLVNSLLGLEVVGLDYPGHISAAVHFSQPVSGDSFRYKGKTYVITDPTYINASAGMTMPAYRKISPEVINISF